MNDLIVTDVLVDVKQSPVETETAAALPWAVVDYATLFERYLQEHDRSDATVRAYSIGLRTFAEWLQAQTGELLDPVRVTPLDVRAFKKYLVEETQLKTASINNYLAGVRAFCRWAQESGHTEHDPSANIKMVAVAKGTTAKWLDRAEQLALRRAADQRVQVADMKACGDLTQPGPVWARRDRAVIYLLLGTALRLNEVVALRLEDVIVKPRSGRVEVRFGKGGKARTVEMPADTRRAVAEWLAVRSHKKGEDALFLSQKGTSRLSARALSEVVRNVGADAKLEGLHPHTLRHTCAKSMIDAGVGIEVVSAMLGHSNLQTTMIYTTPGKVDFRRAADAISWEDDDEPRQKRR
ncbi:MAG: tyrosine-type recombinase/integrase [Anaerolineae bacterium]|nr:tyrosine-type recombinase/integrase [Anaerolineae bacterium]